MVPQIQAFLQQLVAPGVCAAQKLRDLCFMHTAGKPQIYSAMGQAEDRSGAQACHITCRSPRAALLLRHLRHLGFRVFSNH